MALSKANRIIILLVIDSLFFLLELISGYAVHSLALVADSFHMLNDVLSLVVGLWAVKVSTQRGSTKTYTYGWQRAETLGALVNGVFLVALCVTIFLDAIQRFVEPQIVSNPKLVLVVGCLGLASNILGLVLFHDHSHGHGGEGHSHGDEVEAAEEGHAHSHEEHGSHSHTHDHASHAGDTEGSETTAVGSPLTIKASSNSRQSRSKRRHSRSQSRVYMNGDDIPSNPNAIRNSIIQRSYLEPVDSDEDAENENIAEDDEHDTHDHSEQPLLHNKSPGYGTLGKRKSIDHRQHNHAQPKEPSKGGHSHGDLNMRGIFLHVMGDALGNIGVIATALIIWLSKWPGRYYFDPAISLVITCIILASAIPLCKAASRILLQAVPAGIDVDNIQEDIEDLPGIISCHHLHVWQLSDTKKVASLHVQVEFDFKGEGSARYMQLAQDINKCLHAYGIHSSTIQPEFCLDPAHDHKADVAGDDNSPTGSGKRSKANSRLPSKPGSLREPEECLLGCPDDSCGGKTCCEPTPKDGEDGSGHGHGHAH